MGLKYPEPTLGYFSTETRNRNHKSHPQRKPGQGEQDHRTPILLYFQELHRIHSPVKTFFLEACRVGEENSTQNSLFNIINIIRPFSRIWKGKKRGQEKPVKTTGLKTVYHWDIKNSHFKKILTQPKRNKVASRIYKQATRTTRKTLLKTN